MKGNRIVIALVALVLGFLISYSYQYTKTEDKERTMTDSEWERIIELREMVVEQEEKNRSLQQELLDKQQQLYNIESEIASKEQHIGELQEEAESLRKAIGIVGVEGEGVIVSLDDSEYDPQGGDINNFLVHEHHVLKVVSELYISGAEAVAINGKRLTSQSYIVCNGPVITVDGEQFPAPFEISAIGKADVLEKALNIQGGVRDQIVNDNIVIKIEKKNQIKMEPIIGS